MPVQIARSAVGAPSVQHRVRRSRALPALLCASAGALLGCVHSTGFADSASLRNVGRISCAVNERVAKQDKLVLAAVSDKFSEARASAKAALSNFLTDDYLAREVARPEGKPTRGRMDEAIVELEKLNPTTEPVYSSLVDGEWSVKYTGTYAPGLLSSPTRELALFLYGGGFSLGNALSSFANGFWGQSLRLKVTEKIVRISGSRYVQATAQLEFGERKKKLSYSAELMPLSGRRMSEDILRLDLPEPLGKQDVPLELRRTILVTYLDEQMMIVRDESGIPEILVREKLPTVQPQSANVSIATEVAQGNSTAAPANNTNLKANSTLLAKSLKA